MTRLLLLGTMTFVLGEAAGDVVDAGQMKM